MNAENITVITPTTGKDSLFNLMQSILMQRNSVPVTHVLLWDDKREGKFSCGMKPEDLEKYIANPLWAAAHYAINNIILKGNRINGEATGSALRAVGLMAANTDMVTFADDDIMWDELHVQSMLSVLKDNLWAFCKRRIWTALDNGQYEYLGVDNFESVGEEAKTPYKMVDNNCLMFSRVMGVSAAPLYRETKNYNDDRLFYDFLKNYAGEPGKTKQATINQVCPAKLVEFFRQNCTKEPVVTA